MSGPVVGEEGNAGCILAAGGAFAVLFGTAWLLEKVMPTSIASTIAWVALVVFLVLVWKYGFKGRRNALLGSAAFGGRGDYTKVSFTYAIDERMQYDAGEGC